MDSHDLITQKKISTCMELLLRMSPELFRGESSLIPNLIKNLVTKFYTKSVKPQFDARILIRKLAYLDPEALNYQTQALLVRIITSNDAMRGLLDVYEKNCVKGCRN